MIDIAALFVVWLMGIVTGISLGKWLKRREIVEGLDRCMSSGTLLIFERRDEWRGETLTQTSKPLDVKEWIN